jgi:hypothetical protein
MQPFGHLIMPSKCIYLHTHFVMNQFPFLSYMLCFRHYVNVLKHVCAYDVQDSARGIIKYLLQKDVGGSRCGGTCL